MILEIKKYEFGNKEIWFQNWRNMIQFERITIQLISYWRSLFQFHFIDSYWCRKGKHQTNKIEIFHSFRHLLHRMEENKKDDDTRHQGFARAGHEDQHAEQIIHPKNRLINILKLTRKSSVFDTHWSQIMCHKKSGPYIFKKWPIFVCWMCKNIFWTKWPIFICMQDVVNLQSFLHSCLRTISLISHVKRHHCISFCQMSDEINQPDI